MGHYRIGKFKIFYSKDRFREIDEPFLTKLTPTERFGLRTGLRDDIRLKLHNLRISKLKGDLKALSGASFVDKWVNFEFKEKQAQIVALELIEDYFLIHKNGEIVDYRDEITQIIDSFSYDVNTHFPLGEIIGLRFNLAGSVIDSILYYLFISTPNTVDLNLNLTSVKYITGDLHNITIVTKSMTILLRKSITIAEFGI